MESANSQLYDYIIIGAGSAGCVLANRLSADGKWRVCLVEAGPFLKDSLTKMPILLPFLFKTKVWNFRTTPQKFCHDRTIGVPTGKLLGGTSAINGLIYARGHPSDFDTWASLGNEGWSFKEVLPYFKKSEDYIEGENIFHGVNGPLKVNHLANPNPLTETYLQAALQAGYTLNNDFNNGDNLEGVGLFDVLIHNGQRVNSAHAYLSDTKQRKNLTIISKAQVTKVLFEDKCAKGIEIIRNKTKEILYCDKEVILSAGTYNSPKILLLSGVGPVDELQKHNIPIVHELAGVGKNLQDHIDAPISVIEKTKHAHSFHFSALFRNLKYFISYLIFKKSPYSGVFGEGAAFIKSDPALLVPDLQWHFVPMIHPGESGEPLMKFYGYTILNTFLHPYSRGEVTLKDADPSSDPLINPNYLSDERDIEPLIISIQKARDVLAQSAFEPHRHSEYLPGDNVQSREQIINYIREFVSTEHHPVGTNKMGIDKMAVVDPQLKVHGMSGIRVVDASIFPIILTGNPHATTTMIAEKAADMILEQSKTS